MAFNTNSPISIDLGGKYTGFFSFTDTLESSKSGTVIYDDSFVLSQVARRGKRHGKRNNKRNNLVKRLFLLILQKHYGLSIDVLPDEIRGLFNKRGYTYASFELDDKKKEALDGDTLKEFLSDKLQNIDKDSNTETFLNQIASDNESFKNYKTSFDKLFAEVTFKSSANKIILKEEIKNEYSDGATELLAGLRVVKELLDEFDKQENQGNLPRAKYFEELGEYITTNEKVKSFFDSNSLKLQDMTNLIGNISNYQLKELRRYFNDIEMAKGDIWQAKKLHRITSRFIRSWHPKDDKTRKTRMELLERLKTTDIMEFLTTVNPVDTIPPYDDMNNRGAVKCQTLRLNEEYLDKHLPNWRKITATLNHGVFGNNLAECTVRGYSEDSTLLHRLLDTSKEIDIYGLRAKEPNELLVKKLGQSDAIKLHNFAKEYYELIRSKVRTGIWTSSDDMLKRCDHNPPHKTNQIHNLVAAILGVEIKEDKFKEFENGLWVEKFGNKKLSSYCKNVEELRKTPGNLFKQAVEAGEDKDIAKYQKDLEVWTTKIAEFFGIDDEHKQRFNNLFSMAQLYTIIDTPRSGFSSTCKWCTAENRWRSTTAFYNDETGEFYKKATATCQRLPADTQRPFSGKIERYIDKLGFELAKIKAAELEAVEAKKIHVPIILEQNVFEYEESIRNASIKNANKKANEKLEKAKLEKAIKIDAKSDRIKAFSGGVCPYCGGALGDDGEIDHILPRSYTLKIYGTVFNSEGNLIYVHQKCNQSKADSIYKLSDIKADVSAEWIEEQVATIKNFKTFSVLSAEQQKAFRYALFLPSDNEAYKKVIDWLRTDQSTMVNGTQKYLAKKIQEKLTKMLPNKELSFEFILVDAEEVSGLRQQYAKQNQLLQKQEKQAPSSHTIDAVMAFVCRYQKIFKDGTPPNADEVLRLIAVNNIKTKPMSKIQKDQKGNLGGATIFKDSIYQERFAPLYKYNDKYYAGFIKASKDPDFSVCAEVKQQDFEIIKPYIKRQKTTNGGFEAIELDKSKILSLFHDISRGDSEDTKTAELLNKFSYNIIKKKNNVAEAPAILKDDKKLSTKIYGKVIVLPMKQEWLAFDKAFKKYLADKDIEYKEKDGNYNIEGNALDDFCKMYFKIEPKAIRNKARKAFSLPTVESPSGGFRIRRKNHKNEDIFQLVGIDGAKSAGFAVENGKINTSVDVPLATLAKSKNVSFKDPQKMQLQEYVDMSNFRDISNSVKISGVKIFIAPASTNRPLVRCFIEIDKFRQIVNAQNFNYLELSDLKFSADDSFGIVKERFDELFAGCGFAPRDKLKIVRASADGVEFEFSNNNKTVMKYYDNGADVSLND